MAYTLTTLQAECVAYGFDATTYNARFTTWLNEAQHIVCRRVPIRELRKSSTITTVASTVAYSLPTDFVKVASLTDTTNKLPLDPISPEWGDLLSVSTGLPRVYWLDESGVNLYPTPNAVYSFKLRYYQDPVDLSSGADTLTIPAAHQHVCISYALSRAYRSEDDQERANSFMLDFERGLAQMAADRRDLGDGPSQVDGMWGGRHQNTPGLRS